MLGYLLTVLIGLGGAYLGLILKIPTGPLVGSMVAVGIANASGIVNISQLPPGLTFGLQLVLGITLGSRLNPESWVTLKSIWSPVLICTVITIGTGLISGLLLSHWLGMERLTALLSTAPGGISGMSLIALDLGAESSTVVIMHLARLISVILLVPLFVRWVVTVTPQ